MRFSYLVVLGVLFSPAVTIAACGGSGDTAQNSGTTTGDTGTTTGGGGSDSTTTGATTSTTATTAAATTAASSGTGGSGGPDIGQPSDIYPAKHPSPPKVVNLGGPVMQAAKFYPVYFSGDDKAFTDKTTDFTNKFGGTNHWAATTAEYGCGPATGGAPIQLAEKAPGMITDDEIQAWLAAKLNSNDPAFPQAIDLNTGIVLYYPSGTIITQQSQMGTAVSCQQFGGYHNSITLDAMHGNQPVPYLVIPRCDNFAQMVGIDAVTATASHEMMEAATDPTPLTVPAWGQVDNYHFYWILTLGGGEVGDMCAQNRGVFAPSPEIGYVVQRSWSNKSITAGHDPCAPPVANQPYFNAVPVLPDNITIQGLTMKGVKIPIGQTKTVELDLFSDAKTSGPFDVSVIDSAALFGGPAQLDINLDATSGLNGQKLHADISALKKGQYGVEVFVVMTHLDGVDNLWLGLVGN